MTFEEVCNNLASHVVNNDGTVSGPGGCQFRVQPDKPHLGGNLLGGDLGTMYVKHLWPWLIDTFHLTSVLDVGCAEGHCVEFFKNRGLTSVGIEGLPANVADCLKKGLNVIEHDITSPTSPALPLQRFDMVWCCDVAEHISEEYVDRLIALMKLGKVLAFVHGDESHGHVGWHHVNNKSESYWIDLLERHGLKYQESYTARARAKSHGWFKVSGKIFFNESQDS